MRFSFRAKISPVPQTHSKTFFLQQANFIVNSTLEEEYSQQAIAKAGTVGYAAVTRLQIITIADFIVRGRETWLFACVSLFQAVGLAIASLQTYRSGKFSRYWAHLGVFLSCIGVLHFFIDLGREIQWREFGFCFEMLTFSSSFRCLTIRCNNRRLFYWCHGLCNY